MHGQYNVKFNACIYIMKITARKIVIQHTNNELKNIMYQKLTHII
jgi:hypothetical protein